MSHTFRSIGSRQNGKWVLDKEELRHMLVLRLTTNDIVELTDGCGNVSKVRISSISSKSIDLEEIEHKVIEKNSSSLILVVGLLKNTQDLLPLVVESGVDKIYIFQQQHNKKDLTDKNKERFLNIIRSSVKQCKRDFIPDLCFFPSLSECLESINKDQKDSGTNYRKILLDETSNSTLLNLDIDKNWDRKDNSIVVIVGSELGFYNEEKTILEGIELERFSLGKNILRSITACLCSCMIIKLKLYQLNIDN